MNSLLYISYFIFPNLALHQDLLFLSPRYFTISWFSLLFFPWRNNKLSASGLTPLRITFYTGTFLKCRSDQDSLLHDIQGLCDLYTSYLSSPPINNISLSHTYCSIYIEPQTYQSVLCLLDFHQAFYT